MEVSFFQIINCIILEQFGIAPRLLKKYFSSHGIFQAVVTLILTAEAWNISQDIPRGTSICCQSGIGTDFFLGIYSIP